MIERAKPDIPVQLERVFKDTSQSTPVQAVEECAGPNELILHHCLPYGATNKQVTDLKPIPKRVTDVADHSESTFVCAKIGLGRLRVAALLGRK